MKKVNQKMDNQNPRNNNNVSPVGVTQVLNQSRLIQNVQDVVSMFMDRGKQFTTIDVMNELTKLAEYKGATFTFDVITAYIHSQYELGSDTFRNKYNFITRNNHILYYVKNSFCVPPYLNKNFVNEGSCVLWFAHESKNSEMYIMFKKGDEILTRIYKGVDTRMYIRFLESAYVEQKYKMAENPTDEFFYTNIENVFEFVDVNVVKKTQ